MSPDDRRPYRGAPFDRGRGDRPAGPGPDRDRPPVDRPGFNPPRPFVRTPTRGGDLPPPDHHVRLKDGNREIDVSGNPAFVRQVLDDLPTLMARLRGEAPGRSAISMPAPPPIQATAPVAAAGPADEAPSKLEAPAESNGSATSGAAAAALESEVFAVLRGSDRPLAVSAIRKRLDSAANGQQVRRLLELAGDRVTVSSDRPATYALR